MTKITVPEPRELDGDPFEAAGTALDNARHLAREAADYLSKSYPVIRNAAMERHMQAHGSVGLSDAVVSFEKGPQAKALQTIEQELRTSVRRLSAAALAASYDPRNPTEED